MSREPRPLFQEEEAVSEPGRFGCPMLVRPHHDLAPEQTPPMRCSLGWALHNEREITRCIETVNVADCWKTAPEAVVVIPPATGSTSGQRTREPAADAHIERVAGD
jgi:hypothetical protein